MGNRKPYKKAEWKLEELEHKTNELARKAAGLEKKNARLEERNAKLEREADKLKKERNLGNKLIQDLLSAGKIKELQKVLKDDALWQKLLNEYHVIDRDVS